MEGVFRVIQIQILSKSVYFRWSYSRTHEHRQNAPQSECNIRLKPSFKPNNCKLQNQVHYKYTELL